MNERRNPTCLLFSRVFPEEMTVGAQRLWGDWRKIAFVTFDLERRLSRNTTMKIARVRLHASVKTAIGCGNAREFRAVKPASL